MNSSDLCDRALIIYDGRVSAELSGATLTEHNILKNALNLGKRAPMECRTMIRTLRAHMSIR